MVRCHRIAQDSFVSAFLRQAAHQRFPRCTCVAGTINSQPAVARAAKPIGLNWNDIHAVGIPGMHDYSKAKVRRHSVGDVDPVFGMVVRAIQSPMVLQKQSFGTSGMHRDFVHALSELGIFVGHEHGADAPILCSPGAFRRHRSYKRRPLRLPRTSVDCPQGRAEWYAEPGRHCPASSGDDGGDRTDHALMTTFLPRRAFRKVRPVLRHSKARRVPRAGRALSARCSSTKRRNRREIERSPAADWSSSFRNRRWIAAECPNNSA